jgi:hypothetical protein
VGALVLADPWFDYLAFPIAPLVLVAQVGAMFLPRTGWRLALGLACPALIVAMTWFLAENHDPADGAPIGFAFMVLWILATAVIFVAALIRELVGALAGRRTQAVHPS